MVYRIKCGTEVDKYGIELSRVMIEGSQPFIGSDGKLENSGSFGTETELISIEEAMLLAVINNVGDEYFLEHLACNNCDSNGAIVAGFGAPSLGFEHGSDECSLPGRGDNIACEHSMIDHHKYFFTEHNVLSGLS